MIKEYALISIIMPAYNCEEYIKTAIDSILNQTYTNFELLITDDCSKDNTRKIIDSYVDIRIKRFHNSQNQGYLKASNLLFKQCAGDYITFQDADDYSDITRLEKLVVFLENNIDVAVVGSNVHRVDENGNLVYFTNFPSEDKEVRSYFENYKIGFTGSALMLRKEVISTCGIYNEYFNRIGSEDVYWFSNIIDKFKIANIPDILYFYRVNSNSVTVMQKNPKAFICHDLIMKMYFRRKHGKQDYIAQSKTWKKAEVYASFLVEIRKLKLENKKMSMSLVKMILLSPATALEFLNEIKQLVVNKRVQSKLDFSR